MKNTLLFIYSQEPTKRCVYYPQFWHKFRIIFCKPTIQSAKPTDLKMVFFLPSKDVISPFSQLILIMRS